MKTRVGTALLAVALIAFTVWLGKARTGPKAEVPSWTEVAPHIFRSPDLPYGYALVEDHAALLIDAPHDAKGLQAHGVQKIEGVLLTHHHSDTCAAAGTFLSDKVPVRAPRESAEWLTPENVRKFWQTSVPLRNSKTGYFVVPVGLEGIDCSLADGQSIEWHGWTLRVVSTPGHARDHVSFTARKGNEGPLIVFAGDALSSAGKLWTPYTTDWDHWTDQGLKPTASSLRKLAALKPDVLLPAHGPAIQKGAPAALLQTAAAVEEMAFLKSYERFTVERLGHQPEYAFLAQKQAESNGSKPWTRVSDHLWITGNTYVLLSKDNACLVIDPWDKRSSEQIAGLRQAQKLGPIEVVWFSHAHFDHYDGVYYLPDREKFQTWTLDRVAKPLADPVLLRAPFIDARPVKIDKRFQDGDSTTWHEYQLRFRHLPGQTDYTMGVETKIDGKKCFFTADNFFHQYQFSGTGGWMGLNRSWPLPYTDSAHKVLEAAPEWVLAEHGGPFEFNAEDFRRRIQWGEVGAKAADAISPSGNHRHDWDPNRIHIEPLLQKARAGETLHWTLIAYNPLAQKESIKVTLQGRGLMADQTFDLNVGALSIARQQFSTRLGEKLPPGRHIFLLRVSDDGCDGFIGVDVEK